MVRWRAVMSTPPGAPPHARSRRRAGMASAATRRMRWRCSARWPSTPRSTAVQSTIAPRSIWRAASACGGWPPRSLGAFLDLDDLVGDHAVRLAVHGLGRLLAGRLHEAEDLARALVEPVAQIV